MPVCGLREWKVAGDPGSPFEKPNLCLVLVPFDGSRLACQAHVSPHRPLLDDVVMEDSVGTRFESQQHVMAVWSLNFKGAEFAEAGIYGFYGSEPPLDGASSCKSMSMPAPPSVTSLA